jgi:NADH-quinone oxidoreductase subunit M
MIAHGFVVVGLFFISDIILDDMKHELSLKWVVYVHNHHDCFDVLTLVLASVALPTTFNFLRVYGLIAFRKLMYGFFLGGMTIILAPTMLKMYQQVMLEKRIQNV